MEDVKFFKALAKGDIFTKLSVIILGLGNLVRGQIVKGLIFLGIEAAYIYYLINAGIYNFGRFLTLGGQPQEEVWYLSRYYCLLFSYILTFFLLCLCYILFHSFSSFFYTTNKAA